MEPALLGAGVVQGHAGFGAAADGTVHCPCTPFIAAVHLRRSKQSGTGVQRRAALLSHTVITVFPAATSMPPIRCMLHAIPTSWSSV